MHGNYLMHHFVSVDVTFMLK